MAYGWISNFDENNIKDNQEKNNKKECVYPSVTVMIVAHNEEKVIQKKLENVINNDYPKDKIQYIVASDNSNDRTNEIVLDFMDNHKNVALSLYSTKEHKGKTNAQNEAQKIVNTEFLVMTDANAMFKTNAVSELISSFTDESIAYVCGALKYVNTDNLTAESEASYWDSELSLRLYESEIQTITAGNGAIYACRNIDYVDFDPIECHDSSMPYFYGIHNKKALFNKDAIAYEKAGETSEDEYKRKVRMNRTIFRHLKNGFRVLNIFKYGWFSYFYFGHRTTRYLLWFNHLLVFISSLALAIIGGWLWKIIVILQLLFYLIGFIGKFTKNKLFHFVYYYCMTVVAQWHGVFNIISRKAKPTWEKAESTR